MAAFWIFTILFPTLFTSSIFCDVSANPLVNISTGEIEGMFAISRGGREFEKFLGIPYGKIPKRFGMSLPADGWKGVKKAHDSGQGCVSTPMNFAGLILPASGTEDCLTLDVYTPTNSSHANLPVMVWIYGGGFIVGSSNQYDGEVMMDEDVVLVIINYRLGAIGFLNAGTASARGNQGLKDQVLALKWVQENIHTFGGDKDKVTIFGESAGSISVSYMMTSKMTRESGLFHRGIMQSGTSSMTYYGQDNGPELAKKLGQALDCPTSNAEYLVECLQRIDPKILADFGNFFNEFGYDADTILFGPSIEHYHEGENDANVFMDELSYTSAKNGKVAKIPVIMGLMESEMGGWSTMQIKTNATTLTRLNAQWSRHLLHLLLMSKTAEDPGETSTKLNQYFMGGDKLKNDTEAYHKFEHMLDERHWIHPLRLMASEYSKHNGGEVYLYNFTKPTPPIPPPFGTGKPQKPSHGYDIKFFFGIRGPFSAFMPSIQKESEEYLLSKELVKMWAAFAKDGKPKKLWGDTEGLDWPQGFEDENDHHPKFLFIDDIPKVEKVGDWYENNNKFWSGLALKEHGRVWESEP